MAHSILRLPLAAAALVVTGATMGWLASPDGGDDVLAGAPRGTSTTGTTSGAPPVQAPDEAPAETPALRLDRPAGAGILEVQIHGLQIPMGQDSHEPLTATITQLTGGDWSSEAPVVDHRVAFGEVPRGATFALVLRNRAGEARLRTEVVGPIDDNTPAPDYAVVHVSLSEDPR